MMCFVPAASVPVLNPSTDVHALAKPIEYYGTLRNDMVPQLPDPLGRVLDVGCAAGATGILLRERHVSRLVGIEINREAAEAARRIYDEVLEGPADVVLESVAEQFDTILCYDVLEHMIDPWKVLRQLSRVSVPGARLHVSAPNARHLSLMVDVLLRGTFNYQPHGHRDNTHLRWFTPHDLEAAVTNAGFDVLARSHPPISKFRRALAMLTTGKSSEFLVAQWQLLAVRRRDP
jgi:2-polyprenyl-3-methyl-5-hydroxy-6-metoxy-1,4-benzoquinol methylase